jgi:hypothetical protein
MMMGGKNGWRLGQGLPNRTYTNVRWGRSPRNPNPRPTSVMTAISGVRTVRVKNISAMPGGEYVTGHVHTNITAMRSG